MTLSINDTQHNWTFSTTMLCIMLNVITLNVAFYLLLCWTSLCWVSFRHLFCLVVDVERRRKTFCDVDCSCQTAAGVARRCWRSSSRACRTPWPFRSLKSWCRSPTTRSSPTCRETVASSSSAAASGSCASLPGVNVAKHFSSSLIKNNFSVLAKQAFLGWSDVYEKCYECDLMVGRLLSYIGTTWINLLAYLSGAVTRQLAYTPCSGGRRAGKKSVWDKHSLFSIFPSLSLSLSLSLHTHTHILSLSCLSLSPLSQIFLSLGFCLFPFSAWVLSLSLSLTHTHTHTHTNSVSFYYFPCFPVFLFLFLSLFLFLFLICWRNVGNEEKRL